MRVPPDQPVHASTLPYFGAHDHPWMLALIDEYRRFAGRRSAELAARLREPLRVQCRPDRLALARRVMEQLCRPATRSEIPPHKAREALFRAAVDRGPRVAAVRAAADAMSSEPRALLDAMFADLPGEKLLPEPPPDLEPSALALRANLALVAGTLARASKVRIVLHGNARDIVRLAQLRGLLCVVHGDPNDDSSLILEISGPLSLFRRTHVYGRTLASLVPRLAHCDRFELHAECTLDHEPALICVRSGDPIFPADPPKRFDSKLEQRFARDFARSAPDWDLIREPAPVATEGTLIFPDFALVHRRNPAHRAWLEIVGFWTPAYLSEKLRRLRSAGLDRLILCIDANLNCGPDDFPEGARIVRFKRRIDPAAVLMLLEGPS